MVGAVSGLDTGVTGVVVLLVVLLLASAAGVLWRRRQGVIRPTVTQPVPVTAQARALRTDPAFTALGVQPGEITLVQFSSAFCAPCRSTRAVLASVAAEQRGVRHLEVDAESHLDQVRALGISKTPTTLFVDASGREAARASGAPRREQVLAALRPLVGAGPLAGNDVPDLGTRR